MTKIIFPCLILIMESSQPFVCELHVRMVGRYATHLHYWLVQTEPEAPARADAGKSSTISRFVSSASRVARKSSAVWRT